jgi:hypothetical protein
VIVLHAHIDHSLSKVEVLVHLVQAIVDADFIVLIKHSLNVCPRYLSVNNVPKYDRAVAASTRHNCTVMTP